MPQKSSRLRDAHGLADHERARKDVEQNQRMELTTEEDPHAAEKLAPDTTERDEHDEKQHESEARRDGCALVVGNFARLVGELFCRHVVARQPADTTGNEEEKRHRVPRAAETDSASEAGRRHPEAHRVRERVELAPQGRSAVSPSSHSPVQQIEDDREQEHDAGRIDLGGPAIGDIRHREKDGGGPAGRVRQRENIGDMKRPNHREAASHTWILRDWAPANQLACQIYCRLREPYGFCLIGRRL